MRKLTENQVRDFETIYDYLRVESVIPADADAIVVGGSGVRTDMAERAAELYHQGVAPIIVTSGFSHPKFNLNESELLADRARELGVPDEAIICEPRATNTGLNIRLAEAVLRERGVVVKYVILVHMPYMTRRFLATAEAQWPEPTPKFAVTSVDENFETYLQRENASGLGEIMLRSMLKDYAVIKTHPAQGYQTAQPVNHQAEAAYKRLIKQGFEEEVINHTLATSKFK